MLMMYLFDEFTFYVDDVSPRRDYLLMLMIHENAQKYKYIFTITNV